MFIPSEIELLLSSDITQGANNKSTNGAYFEVNLDEPLAIPSNALNVTMEVVSASIWWNIPNIDILNNKLYITGPNINNILTNFVLTIETGLYDVIQLNLSIKNNLENAGAYVSSSGPLIELSGDDATSKVNIKFNYPNVSVDFTQPNTIRNIIGFDSNIYGPYPIFPSNILAENTANFNTVNYFLLHSDLTNKGILFNNKYSQIISQVNIDVAPGSQIVYTPYLPAVITVNELAGIYKSNIRVWLTDDKNIYVNTNNENYSLRIKIKYLSPYIIASNKQITKY